MTNRHSTPALSVLAGSAPEEASAQPLSGSEPVLGGLHGDVVAAAPGQTVFLDPGLDATVADSDEDLAHLYIYTYDQSDLDVLGFHTQGNGIELIGREIRIDNILIGTISAESTGTSVAVDLTGAATSEIVQRLIRALTFTTADTGIGIRKQIGIVLGDLDPSHYAAEATVDVVIASSSVYALTMGTDDLTGTAADDLFLARNVDLAAGDAIAGGGGNDTLRLDFYHPIAFDLTQIAMSGIENIQGSATLDKIIISAEQLEDVGRIDGGGSDHNLLYLDGADFDLTGKTITNFREIRLETDGAVVTTDSEDLAKIIFSHPARNDTLVLTSGELDAAERLALHRQGIETITAYTDGVLATTTHGAPEIANFGGDAVVSNGNNPVLLDAGTNAVVAADDTLTWLEVSVTTRTNGTDVLGIANLNGVTVSGSTILLDGNPIGEIRLSTGAHHLTIALYDATADHVQKLIRALTYHHAAWALDQDLAIRIDLKDASGRRTSQTVTVEANPIPNTPPVVGHLWGDVVQAAVGETVFLDLGQNATVADQEGNLAFLDVFLTDPSNSDLLGIHTDGNGITIANGEIRIDGTLIGTITSGSDESYIGIDFTGGATPALVQRLVRALTYKSTTPDTNAITRKSIAILLRDQDNESTEAWVDVVVAPANVHVLTMGVDNRTGTDADDTFVTRHLDVTAGDIIAGGGGNDTLRLDEGYRFELTRIAMSGIETIQGSAVSDDIIISAEQLQDVRRIDGGDDGYNGLHVGGLDIDLRSKTITDITFVGLLSHGATIRLDSEDLAKKVHGRLTDSDTLVLTAGVLDDAERLDLHRQGVETITDGAGRTTTHHAPVVAHLGGDRVIAAGANPVLLDAGTAATVTDDDGQFMELKAYVTTRASGNDVLALAERNGITMGAAGTVMIDGVSIGSIDTSTGSWLLTITIDPTATEAQVQKLIQALTYRHAAGALDRDLEIKIDLTDVGGRRASHTVTVAATDDPPSRNREPTDLHLSGTTVAENAAAGTAVGILSATDPDADERFTYTLLDDAGGRFAVQGDRLVVANGTLLDYERAAMHGIRMRVTDSAGNSREETLTVNLTDAVDAFTGSTRGDSILGTAGDDVINGKGGKDRLTGSTGRDTFVFDTPVKKGQVPFVTDFNRDEDQLVFKASAFKNKLVNKGKTLPAKFFSLDKPKDGNDFFIYSKKKGVVSYDPDGAGAKKGIEVVKVKPGTKLGAADFEFI